MLKTNTETSLELSIVIPAYNEAGRIVPFLKRVKSYIDTIYPNSAEILVVDDGSTDATKSLANEIVGPSQVISLDVNSGKGKAVATGMLKARGRRRLFIDADGSTPIEEERRLAVLLHQGCDIVIGSRAVGGRRNISLLEKSQHRTLTSQVALAEHAYLPPSGKPSFEPPLWNVTLKRQLLGRAFAFMTRLVLKLPFKDTQCGCKMFTAEATDAIFPKVHETGFAFDCEILYLANLLGFSVAEVGVHWHNVPGSKVRVLRDGVSMFTRLFAIRKRHSELTPHGNKGI